MSSVSAASRFVVPIEFGDPISALFADEKYVLCGTVLGKIWLYDVKENSRQLVAAFSDDAVRGVYHQDGTLYATIGDQYCRQIRVHDLRDQLEVRFDRRSSSSGFKYILQKFNQITMIYPGMTTFVDVVSNDQSMCPYRLQSALTLNIVPMDSFQCLLLLVEFISLSPDQTESDGDKVGKNRKFKIVDVSNGLSMFEFQNPKVVLAKLINEKQMFYIDRKSFVIFQYADAKREVLRIASPHKCARVVAVDCTFGLRFESSENGSCVVPSTTAGCDVTASLIRRGSGGSTASVPSITTLITSVSEDGKVFCWDYTTGTVCYKGSARHSKNNYSSYCSFTLGVPYYVSATWLDDLQTVAAAVGSDAGCHYVILTKCC